MKMPCGFRDILCVTELHSILVRYRHSFPPFQVRFLGLGDLQTSLRSCTGFVERFQYKASGLSANRLSQLYLAQDDPLLFRSKGIVLLPGDMIDHI